MKYRTTNDKMLGEKNQGIKYTCNKIMIFELENIIGAKTRERNIKILAIVTSCGFLNF